MKKKKSTKTKVKASKKAGESFQLPRGIKLPSVVDYLRSQGFTITEITLPPGIKCPF